ncbi:transcription factor HES-4 isoform X1 [Ornithorhynchus anatinus]|uniref:Hes family bHLH transcription factor 4 n=1 Tax=Ornithorhynchus anatinus TaxID=9258 RepID=A0A6I8NWR2_ORNAN|nr:transcription factor HES-4 isoform X1 [Ornithorhynchus anatinus]
MRDMPADTLEKPSASPLAGAPASSSQTPDKPRSASEHRKSSKPIMEKRRRARINESLGQLKTLILDALKKDSSRHSKLEKADILEMTVKHLRSLQRAQMTAALSADPSVLGKYRAGFNECMNEVTRFLSTCEGVSSDVRSRLLSHLAACLGQLVPLSYPPPPSGPPPTHLAPPPSLPVQLSGPAAAGSGPCKMAPAEALSPKLYGGFQLVPATDGQFAFLIPGPAFASSPAAGGPVLPLFASPSGPIGAGGGPGSAGGSPAAPSSPVQGLTSFGGTGKRAPSPGLDRSQSVWRPW